VKNEIDRYIVLNRIARSVIEECRGAHEEFVFTRDGHPQPRMNNSGWKAPRRRAAMRYEEEFGAPCLLYTLVDSPVHSARCQPARIQVATIGRT